MTAPSTSKMEMLAAIPKLRAFAISLCGRSARADDLVQETLMRAWANMGSFAPGSNMAAWLYTILRNQFYSEFRKHKREVADVEGRYAAKVVVQPTQDGHMQFLDFREALAKLVPNHREALILVGASGLTYEEAGRICNCPAGTMKSRVNRARAKLAELLGEPTDKSTDSNKAWETTVDTSSSGVSTAEPVA